jgi:menaquinol-cytochrome c reductase iron-sulfur subunit
VKHDKKNAVDGDLPPANRRSFFKEAACVVLGILLGAIPLAAGISVLLDPLRRKSKAGGFLNIATLEAVPDDGIPRKFPVLSTRVDAWNKFVNVPVGAVYLRREKDGKIEALNVVCPHAGCFVDFIPDRDVYLCPCHNSTFALTGAIANKSSPAARGLDSLEVKIEKGNQVWVKFQNFQAGRAEKIPVA